MKNITCKTLLLFFCMSCMFTADAALPVTTPSDSAKVYNLDEQMVKQALAEFKALSKAERKQRIKDAKLVLKEYKQAKKADDGEGASTNTILLAILAILLPPLAVYLKEGEINNRFWLSVILTLLFWIPGVIYALLLVLDAI